MDLTAGLLYRIKFSGYANALGAGQNFRIGYASTSSATLAADFAATASAALTVPVGAGNIATVSSTFTAPSSDFYYVAIRIQNIGAGNRLFVDNVGLARFGGCIEPSNLLTDNNQPTGALATWTPPTTPPASYFYKLVAAGGAVSAAPIGSNVGTVVSPTRQLTGLTDGTSYTLHVRGF